MIIDIIFQSGGEYFNDSTGIDWAKWLSTICNVLALICSIITLTLAFRIFKTFDVHKKFAEKQLSIVFDLVDVIENTIVEVRSPGENSAMNSIGVYKFSTLREVIEQQSNQQTLENRHLIVNEDVLLNLDFIQFVTNPFLPKSIAKELKKLYVRGIRNFEGREINYVFHRNIITPENYIYLSLPIQVRFINDDDIKKVFKMDGEKHPSYVSVSAYFRQVLLVKVEINKWLKQYGADELNIDP